MKRYLTLLALFFLTSCIDSPLVIQASLLEASVNRKSPAPPLPFENPNIRGIPRLNTRAIDRLEEVFTCLSSGQEVYGLALQNSNIRAEPDADACRMGRTAKGSLVRIHGIYMEREPMPLASTEIDGLTVAIDEIGYQEDIRPIFTQNCGTCHSEVAKSVGLQVTSFEALLQGSDNGAVIIPGNADASKLWQQVRTGKMPLIGELNEGDKARVRAWIDAGAPRTRTSLPGLSDLWMQLDARDMDPASDQCDVNGSLPQTLVNGTLVRFLSCGIAPQSDELTELRNALPERAVSSQASPSRGNGQSVARSSSSNAQAGIQVGPLGLGPPTEEQPYLIPQGGFCIEQRLQRRIDQRSIAALAFAPDGRLFIALDSPPTGEVDPLILFDAFHPSRSVAVVNSIDDGGFTEIMRESSRITGLDYHNGALYLSRAGEVGYIPDGGEYKPLAGGFAVNSQLFHANNGIVASNGWLYVSTGGVRDGWSDGPIVGMGEEGALHVVAGGNRYAARLVRAPIESLLNQRTIGLFQTAARGLRNPYGIAADPAGRIWITDNGATNVPEDVSAGDEVNLLDPRTLSPAAATNELMAPYYGFPLSLNGDNPNWSGPVLALPNTAAPTGITWAYNTIYYAQYGRNPGLYRLARSGGQIVSERILLVWPLLAVTTAPDGALWIGTGTGGLYRLSPGCG